MDYDALRETLLSGPYRVIDFLPRQVPADSEGQYFALERYFSGKKRLRKLYRRFGQLVLKLNCYYDLAVGGPGKWREDLPPEKLYDRFTRCAEGGYVHVLLPGEKTLITLDAGDLYMTVYHPSENLSDILDTLCRGEGLWLRQLPEEK